MKNCYFKALVISFVFLFSLTQSVLSQQVSMVSPLNQAQFTLPVTIPLEASLTGVTYPEPTSLLVQNTLGGYRKLKFGYSPVSLYSPLQNVIAGGNTTLEITMKLTSGTVDWTKILLKPMGLGSLSLQPYITAAGGLSNSYKVIIIPLADFPTTINFSQIANLEFPYSSNAAPFEITISCIKFTGGTTPFVWFGEGKTDNKHNGTGGSGELIASLVQGVTPTSYPQKVEFYSGITKLGEDQTAPYQYSWINPEPGNLSVKARLIMNDNQAFESPASQITVLASQGPGFSVALTQPTIGDTLVPPAMVQLAAAVQGLLPNQPDQLLVTNNLTGYRKLKLGYSATNLYSPLVDVTATGNNVMEITLRDVGGATDWSKIQLRPGGVGTLCLLPYVSAAGGVGPDWTTINIPLSDFISTVNFAAIANLEFPYSASAGNFQLAIKSIRFKGGATPFIWFGFGKTDNKHNGNGGSGELVATLQPGNPTGDFLEKVEFYQGSVKSGEDTLAPYTLTLNNLGAGNFFFSAKAISHLGLSATSSSVPVVVSSPPVIASAMTVNITSPATSTSWLAPLNLPVEFSTTGAVAPGPDYLKVTNTLTGYVKMKLGYSPTSLYTPLQNVIAGGNDTLELVIKNCGGPIDWSKIRVRPAGIGLVNLGSYAAAAGGIGDTWKTIKIPLSAFDPTINFTALSFLEFPYSAGANNFQIGIQRVRFVGGSAPFTWFGEGKTNNANDGDGATGHMTATMVSPNLLAVDVMKVQLYDNGTLASEDALAPFQLTLLNPSPGAHSLQVKMTDTKGGVVWSDMVPVTVISTVPEGHLLLTVTFDQAPVNLTVNKAPLRYNKDFAYSFSLDDGLTDAYTCAFKLLGGGYSPVTLATYPGLFYTNGCGTPIPFRASLMWNSVNSAYSDIHLNTPGYVTWNQLNQMLDSGWAVVNHGYSHATGTTTDYVWQINANDSAIFSHTGRHINHFVSPSGDAGYFPAAWEQGIVCAYSRTTNVGSPYGLKVDNPVSFNQFMIYRDFKSDDVVTPSTIFQSLDNCANLSQNGNHYWYNDFTHHVSPNTVGGSLIFSTFQTYMEHVASLYGQSGTDRVWMAPGQEVFEYLKLRDACPVSWSQFGNQVRILINRDNTPANQLKYAMSFVINANANITSVDVNEAASLSVRGNTPVKLIDLEWTAPSSQQMRHPAPQQINEVTNANPDKEHLDIHQVEKSHTILVRVPGTSTQGNITIFDVNGRVILKANYDKLPEHRQLTITLPVISSGIYLIRFTDGEGTVETGKFYHPQ